MRFLKKLYHKIIHKHRVKVYLKQIGALKRALNGIERSMKRLGHSRQVRRKFWRDFIKEDIDGKLSILKEKGKLKEPEELEEE